MVWDPPDRLIEGKLDPPSQDGKGRCSLVGGGVKVNRPLCLYDVETLGLIFRGSWSWANHDGPGFNRVPGEGLDQPSLGEDVTLRGLAPGSKAGKDVRALVQRRDPAAKDFRIFELDNVLLVALHQKLNPPFVEHIQFEMEIDF